MKNFNIFKKEKSNLIVLFCIVGILSMIIYFGINKDKEYTKNVNLSSSKYIYNENKLKKKDEPIKLNSVISLSRNVLSMKILDNNILLFESEKGKTDIVSIDIKSKEKKLINSSSAGKVMYYGYRSISPNGEVLLCIQDYKNKPVTSILNLKENSSKILESRPITILSWVLDSSGFIYTIDNSLIYYDIINGTKREIYKFKDDEFIHKVEFSSDGTKLYMFMEKLLKNNHTKSILLEYDLKMNKSTIKINSNNIIDMEVFNNGSILTLEHRDGINRIYINTKNKSEELDIKNVESIYLNNNRSKLVIITTNNNYEMEIGIYDVKNRSENTKLSKVGNISGITRIGSISINNENQLAYLVRDKLQNLRLYIYDI
ncbi:MULTISPECIES: hypothetical protein [Romboutsia]|uniref:Six-bladed beta-propeller, TolB-like n=1 Tax=Romboutsia hominis TaxID=1507512 RepID=A0A2P2BQN1_9FIRM|nr:MULTISPECIES: hypothetical protein [Romboutsia]MDB8791270.1 hypothetical protein [Romboutsia sp. 1001216sp1]MDB8801168.1 hypothetical protein [Romboutsia sp. 1001216sp1]MDB8812567.1 hypothetical protein [Romboutsia sp. 1001216sp1]CEI72658.1 Six-bladed beta-propeller, TolB-like [Romboutsia hominis]